MKLTHRKKKGLSLVLMVVFLLSFIFTPNALPLNARAEPADSDLVFKEFEKIWSYLSEQEKSDLENARNLLNDDSDLYKSHKLYLLSTLFEGPLSTIMTNNNLTQDDLYHALQALANIGYQDPNQRPEQLLSFQIQHGRAARAIFGPDVSLEEMLELVLTVFSGLPAQMNNDPEVNETLLEIMQMSDQELWKTGSLIDPILLDLGMSKLRTKHSALDERLNYLGWDNAKLIRTYQFLEMFCDREHKSTKAIMMTHLRSQISLGGSDGLKLQPKGGSDPKDMGTISVEYSNTPLDIKVLLGEQDISSYITWQINNPSRAVVQAEHNQLVIRSPGTAEVTIYNRNNSGSLVRHFTITVTRTTQNDFDGSGTKDDPFQIYTVAALKNMKNYVNSADPNFGKPGQYYELMNDLDLGNHEWTPIGTQATPFAGHFLGNNRTIKNFKINAQVVSDDGITGEYYQGLFGNMKQASVADLSVTGFNIAGAECTGGLAGLAENSALSNIHTRGDVRGTNSTAGLVGMLYNSTLKDSSHQGNVSGYNCGGLAGYVLSSKITSSYSKGSVQGNARAGGISYSAGGAGTEISNCYSQADVYTFENNVDSAGGIVGSLGEGSMSNCYSSGIVKSYTFVGGIAGLVENGSIKNSVAVNPEITYTDYGNRIVGELSGHTALQNNWAYECMKGSFPLGPGIASNQKGAEAHLPDMKSAGFWNTNLGTGSTAWHFANNQMPLLKNSNGQLLPGQNGDFIISKYNLSGDGSIPYPYLIYNEAGLKRLADYTNSSHPTYSLPGKYFRLESDLDLTGYEWVPIGSSAHPFTGKMFDGNFKTINNLTINAPNSDYQGLFGCIDGSNSWSSVESLYLINTNITGRSYVGSIAGKISNRTNIMYSSNNGQVNGYSNVGGLIGYVQNNCFISACFNRSQVTGSDSMVGGIVGSVMTSSTIQLAYSTGAISGGSVVGGIAGYLYADNKVQWSYSTSLIMATDPGMISFAGGLVGIIKGERNRIFRCLPLNSAILSIGRERHCGRVVGHIDYYYSQGSTELNNRSLKSILGSFPPDQGWGTINGEPTSGYFFFEANAWSDYFIIDDAWSYGDVQLPLLKLGNKILPYQDSSFPPHLLNPLP